MTKLRRTLDEAFRLISAVPVSGDAVDVMAAAREKLRDAYQLAEAGEEDDGDGGQDHR